MKTVIETEDLLAAVKSEEIVLSDLLAALEEWCKFRESRGYDVSPVRAHLADLTEAGSNLKWVPQPVPERKSTSARPPISQWRSQKKKPGE